jgi:hypothetical protein
MSKSGSAVRSWNSIRDIVLGHGPDIADRGKRYLLVRRATYRAVVGPTEPSVQCIQGRLFPAVKVPGRKTDHSSLPTDEVKNEWIPTTTSPMFYPDVRRGKFYLLSATFGVVASVLLAESFIVGLGSTLRDVRLYLAPHCKFTNTPACHLYRENLSSLKVSVDTSSQQDFNTHQSFLER